LRRFSRHDVERSSTNQVTENSVTRTAVKRLFFVEVTAGVALPWVTENSVRVTEFSVTLMIVRELFAVEVTVTPGS